MNPDETQVVQPEQLEQEVAAVVDPLDAIEDINELRSKAKALRSQANRYKRDVKEPQKPQFIKEESRPTSYNILEDDVADLLLEGNTKEEVRFIMANGGRKALQDPKSLVAVAIKTSREQRNAENAAGQTGNAGSGYVDAERKVTIDQLKNMSVEEMRKILPHAD